MGCRACVNDPTSYALFGSDALCPQCAARAKELAVPYRSRGINWRSRAVLSLVLLSGGLVTALVLGAYGKHGRAAWNDCAQKVAGPVSKVIDVCGPRPVTPGNPKQRDRPDGPG